MSTNPEIYLYLCALNKFCDSILFKIEINLQEFCKKRIWLHFNYNSNSINIKISIDASL